MSIEVCERFRPDRVLRRGHQRPITHRAIGVLLRMQPLFVGRLSTLYREMLRDAGISSKRESGIGNKTGKHIRATMTLTRMIGPAMAPRDSEPIRRNSGPTSKLERDLFRRSLIQL